MRYIGGFLDIDLPDEIPFSGFLKYWKMPTDNSLTWSNARSAFKYLISALKPRDIWIPAYICKVIPEQVPKSKLKFYPVGFELSPDCDFLSKKIRSGDLVFGVNYFGLPPSKEFYSLVEDNKSCIFVEDCAQSIDIGENHWGDILLYSPRKLVGVADGGILINVTKKKFTISQPRMSMPDPSLYLPLLKRYEDITGDDQPSWHSEYESRRLTLTSSNRRMTKTSLALMSIMDPMKIIERRKENYKILDTLLNEFGFLNSHISKDRIESNFVPFGFPVSVQSDKREEIRRKLFEKGIYTFRHFSDLVAPIKEYENEYSMASELMTLPCDQRYDDQDMKKMADLFNKCYKRR